MDSEEIMETMFIKVRRNKGIVNIKQKNNFLLCLYENDTFKYIDFKALS
jgi:hypothetical protein